MSRDYGHKEIVPLREVSLSTSPRILVLDVSKPGGEGATGQLSKTLFGEWPAERLMHFYWNANWSWRLFWRGRHELVRMEDVLSIFSEFDPHVVYCRPVDYPISFYQMTLFLIKRLAKPYVVHIMDDWIARLQWYDRDMAAVFEDSMKDLLCGASECLSISDAMSKEFARRFGMPFETVSNGVEIEDFRPSEGRVRRSDWNIESPFVVRYCGGLDGDMNLETVLIFARTVNELSKSIPVRLEVYTKSYYANVALRELLDLPAISVFECVPGEEYPELLRSSDLLLIAYNFDSKSIDYTRYSFANKLPEILASATPLMAIGPKECATIQFVQEVGCGQVVLERSKIKEVFLEIYQNAALRERYSNVGCQVVENRFQISDMRSRLEKVLVKSSQRKGNLQSTVALHDYENTKDEYEDFISERDNLVGLSKAVELLGSFSLKRQIAYFGNRGSKLEVHSGWEILDLVANEDSSNRESVQEELESGLEALQEVERGSNGLVLLLDLPVSNLLILKRILGSPCRPNTILCSFDDSVSEGQGYNVHQLAAALRRSGYRLLIVECEKDDRLRNHTVWNSVKPYPCILKDVFASGILLAFQEEVDIEKFVKLSNEVLNNTRGSVNSDIES